MPQKWILTEVNYCLLKHWESCGAPWKMYSSFKLIRPPEKHEHSKHSFLNKMAALFDPLGLLFPYTVRVTVLYYCVMALRSSVHFSRWHTPFEFMFGMEEGYKYFWMWWWERRQWHELLWICQWPSRYIRNCIIKWGRVCKVAQHWQKDVCDKCLRPMVFQGGEVLGMLLNNSVWWGEVNEAYCGL